MDIRLSTPKLMAGLLFLLLLSGSAPKMKAVIYEDKGLISSSTLTGDSTINTFNTTAPVHVFTPNASTAVIEAEEVQVTAIVYSPESPSERFRPIAVFSGALLAGVLLIILRSRRRTRLG